MVQDQDGEVAEEDVELEEVGDDQAEGTSDDGWEDLADAPIGVDEDAGGRDEVDDGFIQDDEGEGHHQACKLPGPRAPSRDAMKKHNLTHWPYAPWCPWCIMGRRNAEPHFQCKDDRGRLLPLLVLDDCFMKHAEEGDLQTVLVGKLYPARKTFACVTDSKGMDEYAVSRMSEFIRQSGLTRFVYKSDQETAIRALMTEAIRKTGTSGELAPVPENSAVGASASNGRAERAIQAVEDLVRTMKAALESRLHWKLPTAHPVFRWLVEHAADIMNKHAVNQSGFTPYEELHGKRARERRVEFGERIFYSLPKKGRGKLDPRWKLGVYLGHAECTNEVFMGINNGNVIKARSMVRVVEESRWKKEVIQRIQGTPADMKPVVDDHPTADEIEGAENPHEFNQEDIEPPPRPPDEPDEPGPDEQQDDQDQGPPWRRVRITQKDIKDGGGYTGGCPRCADLEYGLVKSKKSHNDECRQRYYNIFQDKANAKWRRAAEDLQRRRSRGGDLHTDDPFNLRQDEPDPPAKKSRVDPAPASASTPRFGEPEIDEEEVQEPKSKKSRIAEESDDSGDDLSDFDPADLFTPDGDDDDEPFTSNSIDLLTESGVKPERAKAR